MLESIMTPFAPTLVESTRSIGYSFESALADIIDNSISANAKNIEINFTAYETPYLVVIDDGCGMTTDELKQSMRYGSKNPKDIREQNDLGRFGLGMKMASLSQCRKLTVVSKKMGTIQACKWDLDV